jgi:ubiquinone/menaquinone biosynthesis C-methylase UbiE
VAVKAGRAALTFQDHFSDAAAGYAIFRPRYPDALFAFLAAAVGRHDLAWDCATGSGQAALGLAPHFSRVIATDASPAQIAHATPHPAVEYRVAPAERSGLAAGSVDLVTVAQALHWLDRSAFYAETRRVLAPGGVVAAWCYVLVRIAPAVDRVMDRFYHNTVGPCWPPERRIADERYRTIEFPFAELPAPEFTIEQALTLDELAGYVRTWSGTRRYAERNGVDPVDNLVAQLREPWGDPGARRVARWPVYLRAGRVG